MTRRGQGYEAPGEMHTLVVDSQGMKEEFALLICISCQVKFRLNRAKVEECAPAVLVPG